jgi:PAS domain S-box-containing protein
MNLKKVSIAGILTISICILVTFFISIIAFVIYNIYYSEQIKNLNSEINNLSEKLSDSLVYPMWNFDEEQINFLIVNSMDKNICSISVLFKEEILQYHIPVKRRIYTRNDKWEMINGTGDDFFKGEILKKKEIKKNDIVLGYLEISATERFIKSESNKNTFIFFTIFILFDLIFIGTLYLLLHFIVLKPLKKIEKIALNFENISLFNTEDKNDIFIGEISVLKESLLNLIKLLNKRYQEIKYNEDFLNDIIENIPDMVFVKDARTLNLIKLNKAVEDFFGFSRYELIGKNNYDYFEKEYADNFTKSDREVLDSKTLYDIPEEHVKTKHSKEKILHTKKIPLLDENNNSQYLLGISEDITDKKSSEKKLKTALKEKEVLLKELYHRTKNNMQVIVSFLKIQASYSNDENFNILVKDIILRIKSMSLAHQMLYKSKDLSSINFSGYIKELVESIMEFNNVKKESVSVEFDLEKFDVLIDVAIPCGMVVNELITNIFKYAFPDNVSGKIFIKIKKEHDFINIIISDNGIGIKPGIDLRKVKSLGIQTVFNIIELQLLGTIRYEVNNGLIWNIKFKDDLYNDKL